MSWLSRIFGKTEQPSLETDDEIAAKMRDARAKPPLQPTQASQSRARALPPPSPTGPFRFIALDVETANAFQGSICQVGLACVRDDGTIEAYASYIDPEEPFDTFNTQLHGISAETVAGAPTFPLVFAALEGLLRTYTIIQHSNFDKTAFADACEKYGIARPDWSWRDSVQIARRAWPELRGNGGHGLANLKTVLSLQFDHHDAAEDARAAAQIVLLAECETNLDFGALSSPAPKKNYPKMVEMDGAPDGPLAGQTAVFTGALSISRTEAATLASGAGMTVTANVTKKTTVLIVGDQDLTLLAGHEKSSKHRRAEELAASGQPIKIIGESEFRSLIGASGAAPFPKAAKPLTKTTPWITAKAAVLGWRDGNPLALMEAARQVSRLLIDEMKRGALS